MASGRSPKGAPVSTAGAAARDRGEVSQRRIRSAGLVSRSSLGQKGVQQVFLRVWNALEIGQSPNRMSLIWTYRNRCTTQSAREHEETAL